MSRVPSWLSPLSMRQRPRHARKELFAKTSPKLSLDVLICVVEYRAQELTAVASSINLEAVIAHRRSKYVVQQRGCAQSAYVDWNHDLNRDHLRRHGA
ncbi:hypothetical protein [Mycobacterium sp. SMC-13]|uniref:hypothetical protein n=1 Tax=Mycobacterium sp. SMC-13 TaxID=3381626 RepID=UPI003876594A